MLEPSKGSKQQQSFKRQAAATQPTLQAVTATEHLLAALLQQILQRHHALRLIGPG